MNFEHCGYPHDLTSEQKQRELSRIAPYLPAFRADLERSAARLGISVEDLIDGAIRSHIAGYRCLLVKAVTNASSSAFSLAQQWQLLLPDSIDIRQNCLDLDWSKARHHADHESLRELAARIAEAVFGPTARVA